MIYIFVYQYINSMIDISKLFESKMNNKIDEVKINQTPALKQGEKFKKYQNKIQNSLEKRVIQISEKEGFDNMEISENGLTSQTNKVIDENHINNSTDQEIINNLRNEYQNTLNEYEKLLEQINGTTSDYLNRINPNNPYLGKNIAFSNGSKFYVTKQGIAKLIPNTDILNSLNIPKDFINLDIPWSNDYNTQGTRIPTNPPLIVGTPLKYGQSVGNEGSNVFVNNLLPSNVSPTYMGCYASSPNNDNMTFIGNKPSSINVSINNGSFDQPTLSKDSYKSVNDNRTVPGWGFTGTLLNNSKSWGYPIPYPRGNQCVSLQKTNNIRQNIDLYVNYTYTLTFYACGRDCCKSPNSGNPINIDLSDVDRIVFTNIYKFTPPVNKWTYYSVNFKVTTSQKYTLFFSGKTTDVDRSSAIQAINITADNISTGDYTYDQCKMAAINNGYQYFALQNVNTSTSKGYCAVSNSSPAIQQYGKSEVPSKLLILWSSNTGNQQGNITTLTNTGSLSVTNSSGKTLYSTPVKNPEKGSYIGCYGDTGNRAMQNTSNGAYYSLNKCEQLAKDNGYKYYAGQNGKKDSNGNWTVWCAGSNDLSTAKKYGPATNCINASGTMLGGGWSNAIYSLDPVGSYYLILQDDGNMCIYRGSSPSDNQGNIWCSGTNGKQQAANSAMVASKNKYGKNWMSSGSTLASGDFISSNNGNLVLMMQDDGNLVLYTYVMETNCKKMNDGNMGGGINANASYNIGKKAFTQNMGLLGLVDEDSNLQVYPSDNQKFQKSYSLIEGVDSGGNDIPGAAFANATLETCEKACNSRNDCAGFVLNIDNKYNKGCWPKTKSMYPFQGKSSANSSLNLYVRNRIPKTLPIGITENTNNIDSIMYENYLKGGKIENKYGLSNINDTQKQQLEQMETKLNLLTKQMNDYTNKYGNGAYVAEEQSKTNVSGLNGYLNDLNKANKHIINVSGVNTNGLQNILKDSDIVVLQKNYDYLFWSILATGTVLVSMNIVKNQ